MIHTPWPDTDVSRLIALRQRELFPRGAGLPSSPARAHHALPRLVQTWLGVRRQADPDGYPVASHAARELRSYFECGILACGFARANFDTCGHDFLVAFSCKGREMCPSCGTRRMVGTAAYLVEHVFPRVPVRQWW